MKLINKYQNGDKTSKPKLPKKTVANTIDIYSAEQTLPLYGSPDTIIWALDNTSEVPTYRYAFNGENYGMGGQYPGQVHELTPKDSLTFQMLREAIKEGYVKLGTTPTAGRQIFDWARNVLNL